MCTNVRIWITGDKQYYGQTKLSQEIMTNIHERSCTNYYRKKEFWNGCHEEIGQHAIRL